MFHYRNWSSWDGAIKLRDWWFQTFRFASVHSQFHNKAIFCPYNVSCAFSSLRNRAGSCFCLHHDGCSLVFHFFNIQNILVVEYIKRIVFKKMTTSLSKRLVWGTNFRHISFIWQLQCQSWLLCYFLILNVCSNVKYFQRLLLHFGKA